MAWWLQVHQISNSEKTREQNKSNGSKLTYAEEMCSPTTQREASRAFNLLVKRKTYINFNKRGILSFGSFRGRKVHSGNPGGEL